tara:strand:- start:432 stop:671 length:240 start_codon:yes stop_codon:yes gene_type:complete
MDRIIERKCIICKREFLKRANTRDRGKRFRSHKGNKWKRVIRPKMTYTCTQECSNKYLNAIIWYRQRGRSLGKAVETDD